MRGLEYGGFVSVVEELTEREKELAEGVAKRIAADPASHDPDWHNHLPEAEAIVLTQQRARLVVGQILLDERAARKVAQELGLPLTGFPGVVGRAGLDGLLTQHENSGGQGRRAHSARYPECVNLMHLGLDGLLTQDEIRQLLHTCRQQGTHYSDELIETMARTYGR
jgi:hypothetical protein